MRVRILQTFPNAYKKLKKRRNANHRRKDGGAMEPDIKEMENLVQTDAEMEVPENDRCMDAEDGNQMMITLDTVQKKYLQLSKKKIRNIVNTYLRTMKVGNKILVDRKQLEEFLSDPERDHLI